MDELKKLIEQLQKAFEDFKVLNDQEHEQLKTKGHADPVLTASVEKANAEITRLQARIEEMDKKGGRPGRAEDQEAEEKAAHKQAFGTYVRKGRVGEVLTKATEISVGSDPQGGYLVPDELDRQILQLERNAAPMEQIVSSITVSNETYEKVVNKGGATAGWVGEQETRAQTDANSFASIKPPFGEIYAMPAVTQKSLDDMAIDVEGMLAEEVAFTFADKVDAAIISGDGVGKPMGILSTTLAATADASRAFGQIEKVTSGSSGDFDADKLIDLVYALKPRYRQAASWVMAGLTQAKIRKFKDEHDQYLWQPGLQLGQPAQLLGYPIVEAENMPAVAAAAAAVMFGDFKRGYQLANVRGVRVLRDPLTQKGKVLFYTTKRLGGSPMDTQAIKVLVLS